MTLRTITVITTDRTASAAHGTGAGIIPLGTRGASLLGDTTDGTTRGTIAATGDGMILGTTADGTEDGMTLGITAVTTEDTGDGMTLGTTTTIITDGTTRTGITIIMVRDTSEDTVRKYGTAQGMRPDPTGSSQAAYRQEEASEQGAPSAETVLQQAVRQQGHRHLPEE